MKQASILSEIILHRFSMKIFILFISFIAACVGIMGPLFQKIFIDHLTGNQIQTSPLIYILYAFICLSLGQILYQFNNYLSTKEALSVQKIIGRKVYSKILSLRSERLTQKSIGEIVSLYSTDVPGSTIFIEQTLPQGASTLFPLIVAPIAIWKMIGIPLWPTIITMAIVSIINTSLAFRQSKFFFNFKQLAAERAGLVVEWIQHIRVLRSLNWVESFEKKIFVKRKIETTNRISMVTNGQAMNAISSSVTFAINGIAIYSLLHFKPEAVTSGDLFALLWILGVFLTRPFRQMPWFFTFAFDAWTSVKRLDAFLFLENQPIQINSGLQPSKNTITLEDLNLQIDKKSLLKNIHVEIKSNEFVAIVGEVGCGKSLLLLSLLGETGFTADGYQILENCNPDKIKSSFAYVPQEGFIMSASLRENIQLEYHCTRENDEQILQALELAQFGPDLALMKDGLDSPIGERGVNLSGGQRQRVSLARIAMTDAPIVLLDDCLSAVDTETEGKIIDQLLLGQWKNKTRLIATHRLSILDRVDRIVFMENGEIKATGTLAELMSSCPSFAEFKVSHAEN